MPPKFLEELCDPCTSFNNKTTCEILDYLFENFSNVSEGDVEKLEQVFIAPFNPLEPFRNYVKTIEETMRSAEAAGCLCISNQVVTKA